MTDFLHGILNYDDQKKCKKKKRESTGVPQLMTDFCSYDMS